MKISFTRKPSYGTSTSQRTDNNDATVTIKMDKKEWEYVNYCLTLAKQEPIRVHKHELDMLFLMVKEILGVVQEGFKE